MLIDHVILNTFPFGPARERFLSPTSVGRFCLTTLLCNLWLPIPSLISLSHLLNEFTASGSRLIAFSPLLLTHACHTHAIGRCFYPNHLGRWT